MSDNQKREILSQLGYGTEAVTDTLRAEQAGDVTVYWDELAEDARK